MTVLWPIAVITFKEGIRNRAIYGISIFAFLLLAANLLISNMIMQEVGKVAVDMALATISFTGLLLVLFVGINLMAKDLDKKTIYMVLSMVKLSYPGYFPRFSWPLILLSISFITISLILLSALTFLFASFSSTSFITLVLTIISYIIGQSIMDVKALVETPQAVGIKVSPVTVKIVQAAYYIFPNLSIFDIKLQAAHGLPISLSYIFWAVSYGVVYTALAIIVASVIFRRREFP